MTEKDYNMAEQEKLKPKQKPHYVDNKKFLEAMTEYRALRIKAEEEGKRLLDLARQDIENERKATLTEVRNLVATLSVDVAEKLLRKELHKDEAQEAYLQQQLRELHIPAR